MMAVPKALPKTTKIILEVRHGCRDRPSRLSSELRRLCSLPLPKAHYFFVMCNAQACDIMDEVIRSRATTDGHLDVSALSPRFALRWCSLAAVWLHGS